MWELSVVMVMEAHWSPRPVSHPGVLLWVHWHVGVGCKGVHGLYMEFLNVQGYVWACRWVCEQNACMCEAGCVRVVGDCM